MIKKLKYLQGFIIIIIGFLVSFLKVVTSLDLKTILRMTHSDFMGGLYSRHFDDFLEHYGNLVNYSPLTIFIGISIILLGITKVAITYLEE